jgi:MFS family permease
LGRKKLFSVTPGLYLVSAFLTALSWNFTSFAIFRFLTGTAIGGEYSAINSAIEEPDLSGIPYAEHTLDCAGSL